MNVEQYPTRAFHKVTPFLNHSSVDPVNVVGNTDAKSFESSSSSPRNNFTSISSEQTITLDLKDYKNWSAEIVAHVLVLHKKEGGVGLSIKDAQSFYACGFDGKALYLIANNIEEQRKEGKCEMDCEAYAIKAMFNHKDLDSIRGDICYPVVWWVSGNLVPKPYHQWNTRETLIKLQTPKSEGGAGLSMGALRPLKVAEFTGSHLVDIVVGFGEKKAQGATEEDCIKYGTEVMISNKDFASVPETTCKAVAEWIVCSLNNSQSITIHVDNTPPLTFNNPLEGKYLRQVLILPWEKAFLDDLTNLSLKDLTKIPERAADNMCFDLKHREESIKQVLGNIMCDSKELDAIFQNTNLIYFNFANGLRIDKSETIRSQNSALSSIGRNSKRL